MVDLNNSEEIKRLDPKNVLQSADLFLEQCRQIHTLVENFSFTQISQPISNIVFCGMGGSALGAQVVYYLFKDKLKKPLYINNDYDLPSFVDKDTLVILSSYSGGTEETLACFQEAKKRGTQLLGLTTGGKLAQALKAENYPVLTFDPINNPCGQPRMGTGYNIVGTIEILRKLKLLELEEGVVSSAITSLEKKLETIKQSAKVMAPQIFGQIPLIIASSHLSGCAHILRNQFNETAKSTALYALLPELNHHLMEGLKNPADKKMIAISIESDFYPPLLQKRVQLTKDVLAKNNLSVLEYKPQGEDKITQALETVLWGGYLTFYLAMLYEQDPSLIPWVDYFKEQLAAK